MSIKKIIILNRHCLKWLDEFFFTFTHEFHWFSVILMECGKWKFGRKYTSRIAPVTLQNTQRKKKCKHFGRQIPISPCNTRRSFKDCQTKVVEPDYLNIFTLFNFAWHSEAHKLKNMCNLCTWEKMCYQNLGLRTNKLSNHNWVGLSKC